MKTLQKFLLPTSIAAISLFVLISFFGEATPYNFLFVVSLALLALYINLHPKLKSFAFVVILRSAFAPILPESPFIE